MGSNHSLPLSREDSQLVVIDIQDKLFKIMPEARQELVKKNAAILIQAAQELGVPITVTEQYPKGIGPTIPELSQFLEGVPAIAKTEFSAAELEEFRQRLDHLPGRRIVLVGMETHICVLQTALGLMMLGYDVHVVEDACVTRLEHNHPIGLNLLERAGAAATSTETVMFQWLYKAGTPEFKKLQKLII